MKKNSKSAIVKKAAKKLGADVVKINLAKVDADDYKGLPAIKQVDLTDGGKVVGTIDLTPSWASLVPVFVALIREGKDDDNIRHELNKMGRLADEYVKATKVFKAINKIVKNENKRVRMFVDAEAVQLLKEAGYIE